MRLPHFVLNSFSSVSRFITSCHAPASCLQRVGELPSHFPTTFRAPERSCFCSSRAACRLRVSVRRRAFGTGGYRRSSMACPGRLRFSRCFWPPFFARPPAAPAFPRRLPPRRHSHGQYQTRGRHEAPARHGLVLSGPDRLLAALLPHMGAGIGGCADLCIMARYALCRFGHSVVETRPARLPHIHFPPLRVG